MCFEKEGGDKMKSKIIKIPFNIESKLFNFYIFKFENGKGAFMLNIHHLISDAWTLALICNEIIKTYSELKNNQENEEASQDDINNVEDTGKKAENQAEDAKKADNQAVKDKKDQDKIIKQQTNLMKIYKETCGLKKIGSYPHIKSFLKKGVKYKIYDKA